MLPEKIRDFGWFGAGWAVFKGSVEDPDFFPPLNDIEAQREWLAGFGAAWAESPDDEAIASILLGDGTGGTSLDEALAEALQGREDLLQQLGSHGPSRASRTLN